MKMYIKWSKEHGCEGRIVEKYPSSGSGIRRATLEFEKEFVYGYLSGEKGVHKMIRSSLDGSVVREVINLSYYLKILIYFIYIFGGISYGGHLFK